MVRSGVPSFMTSFVVTGETLLIDLAAPRSILSSAPRGGGSIRTRYILNHQVSANPIARARSLPVEKWGDPSRYLGRVAARMGVKIPCVALMTAVPMKHLVVMREEWAGIWVEGFFTVGISNAVRAGEPVDEYGMAPSHRTAGTINIILVTNARLTASALVGAVQVVTESKTATLLSHQVPSHTGRSHATGTGTDAVVIACGNGSPLRYSGTHTKFGELIGRLVQRGVMEGLLRSRLATFSKE
jgi:adenosylcobinamide hydrolase